MVAALLLALSLTANNRVRFSPQAGYIPSFYTI